MMINTILKGILALLVGTGLYLGASIEQPITGQNIDSVLASKTQKEKVKTKTKELAKVKFNDKFIKKGIEVEIIGDIEEIEGGIQYFARAWKDGKPLGFGKDGTVEIERFRIYNPPILVDDANGDIIREWIDEDTDELVQRKLKYDPMEAIKQDLTHTISLVGLNGKDIIEGKVGNTTTTLRSVAGVVSPADGRIGVHSANDVFSTIRTSSTSGVKFFAMS